MQRAVVRQKKTYDLDLVDQLASKGTTWHFRPPLSPHFNGLAESGVKSMKHHLKRVVGESTLTFKELTTFLAQTEACLNSMPLYPLTSDPHDMSVLTPGHFLINQAMNAILDINPNRLDR